MFSAYPESILSLYGLAEDGSRSELKVKKTNSGSLKKIALYSKSSSLHLNGLVLKNTVTIVKRVVKIHTVEKSFMFHVGVILCHYNADSIF